MGSRGCSRESRASWGGSRSGGAAVRDEPIPVRASPLSDSRAVQELLPCLHGAPCEKSAEILMRDGSGPDGDAVL